MMLGKSSALLFGVAVSAALLSLWSRPKSPASHPAVPSQHREQDYLGAGACQACHPTEYESWQKTYHRSMTREPKDLDWDGNGSPSLPISLQLEGREFHILERQKKIYVQGPDLHELGQKLALLARLPDASREYKTKKKIALFSQAKKRERELVLVTGSHNYLGFWLEGGEDQELRQLPFVFLLEERKWVPRREAFLQPPDAIPNMPRWNANCVQCHAVAGRPRQSEGRDELSGDFWQKYETDAADLGIACEACHGPGKQHVQHYSDPLTRHNALASDKKAKEGQVAFMVNPKEFTHEGERNACGQCHSYFLPKDPEEWWKSGFSRAYVAGDPLSLTRTILRSDHLTDEQNAAYASFSAIRASLFWEEGSMIVGGREFNGLVQSPCFENGEGEMKMGCTSCHTMHQGQAAGQIDPRWVKEGMNSLCTQCHEDITDSHSRHLPGQPGSLCVNCHMPRTSYALLKGVRSHRISSPHLGQESPPSPCALCHIDRKEEWIDTHLTDDFGLTSTQSATEESDISWASSLALSGNAAQRAILAYALGQPEAAMPGTLPLRRQLLRQLGKDNYAAVRLIAERSQSNLPPPHAEQESPAAITQEALERALARQDQTPITISE